LYRHFPTRESLAEAVYRARINELRIEAEGLLTAASPEAALTTWLRSLVVFGSTQRGLSTFLKAVMHDEGSSLAWCKQTMRAAGGALLNRAQQSGAVRPDLEVSDLLRLAHAISWAIEPPSDDDRTDRFLSLLLEGLRRHDRTVT
ncbi:MAG: TetR/AcrR family transcriptional regulator, partial [Chloroflexota bacterium]